jgi:hypothetical protein
MFARHRLAVPVAVCACAVIFSAAPGGQALAATPPTLVPGTPLPVGPTATLANYQVDSVSDDFIAATYGLYDHVNQPRSTLYRLSDGATVRVIGPVDPVGTAGLPYLSGSSLIGNGPTDADGTTRTTISDASTGLLRHTIVVPPTDAFQQASEAGVVTIRDAYTTPVLHLLRPDGADVTVGPVPLSSLITVLAGDTRTFVYMTYADFGFDVWALDLATGMTHLLGNQPLMPRAVLTPNRIYRTAEALTSIDLTWTDRLGAPGGQTTVINDGLVRGFWPVGDSLLVERPTDASEFDLAPLDLGTGALGAVTVTKVRTARQTPDGHLILIRSYTLRGTLSTIAPGDVAPVHRFELPAIPRRAAGLGLSGARVAGDFNDLFGPAESRFAAFSLTPDGREWRPGIDGSPAAGALGALAGDVVSTLLLPVQGQRIWRLSWAGGHRDIPADFVYLGRRGHLALVGVEPVEVQDVRTGAVVATVEAPAGDRGAVAIDGRTMWQHTAAGTLVGTDTTGAQAVRTIPAPCQRDTPYTRIDVDGRWALVTCPGADQWVVDLEGALPAWHYGLGGAQLGSGFLAEQKLVDPIGPGVLGIAVTEIGRPHRVRTYGPLGAPGDFSPTFVTDDAGRRRLLYADTGLQVRLVSVGWVTAPPDLDTRVPTLVRLAGSPSVAPTSEITFAWTFKDTGTATKPSSGLRSYDVRYRKRAAGASSFTAWANPAPLQATTATSTSLTAPSGTTVCWQVRARDGALNVSAWSSQRCSQAGATPA